MTADPPWFRVLGPVEAGRQGHVIPMSGVRQRRLLAMLLAARGAAVSIDVLADALWGEWLPAHPSAALHNQVSRLRRTIAELLTDGCALVTRAPGYALEVPSTQLDSIRFEELIDRARSRSGDVESYDAALRLWRGPAFAEFADLPLIQLESIRLDELRAAAIEERASALLDAGRPDLVVPGLRAFVAEQPLREDARAALMRALYATGRHGEALEVYQEYRDTLAEELGLEPSAALQQLEHRVLTHELGSAAATLGTTAPTDLRSMVIRFVRCGDRALATTTVGTGRPLVVVPGWVTSLDVISQGRDPRSSLIEHLVRRAQVTLYDRAGTGLSRGEVDDFSVEAAADELLAVLATTGPAALLAISQSGPTAIVAATRRPDLVRCLVLCGSYADGPATFPNTEQNEALTALARANFCLGSRVLADLYRPGASAEAGEHLARVLRDSADPDVAAGHLEATYRTDVTALLGQVAQPALVMHYRHDRVIPFRGGEQLAAGLPNSQFVPFEGRYHLPDVKDLSRFVDLITDLLARVP